MPINFIAITPIEIRPEIGSDAGALVYATHRIEVEGKDNYYLLIDYMQENPSIVAAELTDNDLLVPVGDELAEQIRDYISPITLPHFPSYEEVKEVLKNERTIQ